MYLKLAQQSVKVTQYVMDDLFNFFCTELATKNSFATRDKFEVLHLPDVVNDVQFPSLFYFSLQLESKKYFNLQYYDY